MNGLKTRLTLASMTAFLALGPTAASAATSPEIRAYLRRFFGFLGY